MEFDLISAALSESGVGLPGDTFDAFDDSSIYDAQQYRISFVKDVPADDGGDSLLFTPENEVVEGDGDFKLPTMSSSLANVTAESYSSDNEADINNDDVKFTTSKLDLQADSLLSDNDVEDDDDDIDDEEFLKSLDKDEEKFAMPLTNQRIGTFDPADRFRVIRHNGGSLAAGISLLGNQTSNGERTLSGGRIIRTVPSNGQQTIESFNRNIQLILNNAKTVEEKMAILRYQQLRMQKHQGLPEEEEEEMGHGETFADYMPAKLKLGRPHPDPVVETSSLASVPPPDVRYKVSLPSDTISKIKLSALQLEAITYACQKHDTFLSNGQRLGYLIGDGAGVGKGRTIAGLIFENYLLGRKRSIWLSVSADLKFDADRDLKDIGAGKINTWALNKLKYGKIQKNGGIKKGVIFSTYASLIGESQSSEGKYNTRMKQLLHWCGSNFDGIVVFDECHKAKNLHPSKSGQPSKTGLAVISLQKALPKARIVYASATGASEPRNMAYMSRLGIWGPGSPFPDFSHFLQAVEKRGVGAMELVAMDMKRRGLYTARQLSFKGVSFDVNVVQLQPSFVVTYDKCVHLWVVARRRFQEAANLMNAEKGLLKSMWGEFWSSHQRFFKYLCIAAKIPATVKLARTAIKEGKSIVIGLQSTGEARTLDALEEAGGELTDFVSTTMAVFQNLVDKHFPAPDSGKLASILGLHIFDRSKPVKQSVKRKARPVKSKVKRRKTVAVKSSVESSDDSLSDFSSSSDSLIEVSDTDEDECSNLFNDDVPWIGQSERKMKAKLKPSASSKTSSLTDSTSGGSTAQLPPTYNSALLTRTNAMKQELLNMLEALSKELPVNSLDEIIDLLGGPSDVAEMTGRKGRIVSNDSGAISYESRCQSENVTLEMLNIHERELFMNDVKQIAIISEAASSGISLQADRRVPNQRRRVHITLELPWSADRAIQQFGRTHRSNQVSAPQYIFLISELAGEQRFASTVAKRLESLGALTHGDRRATETQDLSQFNIDNKFGRESLEIVMNSVCHGTAGPVCTPSYAKGNFYENVRTSLIGVGLINEDGGVFSVNKEACLITKFLNRLLGMEVANQRSLFEYFTTIMNHVTLEAKKSGTLDMGITDIGKSGEKVSKLSSKVYTVHVEGSCPIVVELNTLSAERGLSWGQVLAKWQQSPSRDEAQQFYRNKTCAKPTVVYVERRRLSHHMYSIYRPNTGLQLRAEKLSDIAAKFKKCDVAEAQRCWEAQYLASDRECTHSWWRGSCRRMLSHGLCEVGLRRRKFHVLTGSILGVFNLVEKAMVTSGNNCRLQLIRLWTDTGERIVGTLIPSTGLVSLETILTRNCPS